MKAIRSSYIHIFYSIFVFKGKLQLNKCGVIVFLRPKMSEVDYIYCICLKFVNTKFSKFLPKEEMSVD